MRINQTDWTAPARRDVLRIVLAAGVAGLTRVGAAARDIRPRSSAAELFAFRAPTRSALVFALAFPAQRGIPFSRMRMPVVRIHAGPRSWTVGAEPTTPGFAPRKDPGQLFVGCVARLNPQGDDLYNLVVVSAPAASFPTGELAISADISNPLGARIRIGNPIVAELLARDASFSKILRRFDSQRDRARFAEALTDLISTKSFAAGHPDPRARGEWFAAMLASDTLSFDASRPEGFTFAGQNGRRPFDATADVVDTLLSGIAAPRRSHGVAFLPSDEFPFFSSVVA